MIMFTISMCCCVCMVGGLALMLGVDDGLLDSG